jgi:receptor expression-enhancing protein 5/6
MYTPYLLHMLCAEALTRSSGAQLVFHSFIQPVFARFFASGSTSANLKAQAEAASKSQ